MPSTKSVGLNIARLRKRRGLTLDGLAELSTVSRATISALENGSGNPRIHTLWNLADALGVSFGELVNGSNEREITDLDGVTVSLIDRQTQPQIVEAYLMNLPAHTKRQASAHAQGVKEHIVMLSGAMEAGPVHGSQLLQAGQSYELSADVPHIYATHNQSCRAIVTVFYPKQEQTHTAGEIQLDWPASPAEWDNLTSLLERISLEIKNGCNAARIRFKQVSASPTTCKKVWSAKFKKNNCCESVRLFFIQEPTPEVTVLYRTPPLRPLPRQNGLSSTLLNDCRQLADKAADISQQHAADTENIYIRSQTSTYLIEATLAAEVLTKSGHPTVPTAVSSKQTSAVRTENDSRLFEDRIDVDAYEAYELVHPAYARQVVAAAESLPFMEGASRQILDIGTGPGLLLQMLLELRPDVSATAVDPSVVAYNHLIRRFAENQRVKPVQASITEYEPEQLFDSAVSIGASHHLDTTHFFSSIRKCLRKGGTLVVADELLSPFRNRQERNLALITHHLWYVLDTLFELPSSCSGAELAVNELLRRNMPIAMYLAQSACADAAVRLVRETLETLMDTNLEANITARESVFNRFHILELQALVAGFDYEVEQKTYPQRFIRLAESCGFALRHHQRIYATHGDGDLDAGTHLFVLEKR